MIRKYVDSDIDAVMQNMVKYEYSKAHGFISPRLLEKQLWCGKRNASLAEIYVYGRMIDCTKAWIDAVHRIGRISILSWVFSWKQRNSIKRNYESTVGFHSSGSQIYTKIKCLSKNERE